MASSTNGDQASILDVSAYPTAQKLHAPCAEFFAEVQDLTPGKELLEQRLNTDDGTGNPYDQDFFEYILQGLKEASVAETKLDGDRYRRGKIRPSQFGKSLLQHHDRVHGKRRRVLGTTSRASLRQEQVCYADR